MLLVSATSRALVSRQKTKKRESTTSSVIVPPPSKRPTRSVIVTNPKPSAPPPPTDPSRMLIFENTMMANHPWPELGDDSPNPISFTITTKVPNDTTPRSFFIVICSHCSQLWADSDDNPKSSVFAEFYAHRNKFGTTGRCRKEHAEYKAISPPTKPTKRDPLGLNGMIHHIRFSRPIQGRSGNQVNILGLSTCLYCNKKFRGAIPAIIYANTVEHAKLFGSCTE